MEAKVLSAATSTLFGPCNSTLSCGFATHKDKIGCVRFQDSRDAKMAALAIRAFSSSNPPPPNEPDSESKFDKTQSYTLEGIRNFLSQQKDNLIFSLVERAQFCYNSDVYNLDVFPSKDSVAL